MNTKLPLKINDYVRYASISQQHYKGALYSDSALNCRKACEAICKVIIYNTYSEKLADTKVEYCNLKDLITLVIKDGLAERKVINWLESLQIIGNKSAHDNEISKEEANYSLHALNLLTDWLFIEYLKSSVPQTLLNDESYTKPVIEPPVIEKIIVQEKISQETEDHLINRFQNIIEEKNKGNETQLKLDADTISEIKKSLDETNQKINTINASKIEAEKEVIEPIVRPKPYKKWMMFLVIAILISGISYFVLTLNKDKIALETPINKHPDSIYVAINDFKILQDNPNINFKIESILQTHIDNIAFKNNLPIKITYTHFKQSDFITDTAIINHAERLGYDMIYLGNVYETALIDSNIIEINGSLCASNNRINRNHNIKFKNLTDSTLIKELNDQTNLTAFYFAYKSSNTNKVLSVLDNLIYYSTENYISSLNLIVNLNLKLNNYQACLNGLNKIIPLQPPNAYYTGFKAGMFLKLNLIDSSEIYSKKALVIDSTNVRVLINLAETYSYQNKNVLAEPVLLKALQIEPYHELANIDLAMIYTAEKKLQLAKRYALIAHRINPENAEINFILAEHFVYNEIKKDSAEYYYYLLFKKDSNFVAGLNSLGNYYLKYYPNKIAETKYLFTKANKISNADKTSNLYGLGISAFKENNYKACIDYLEKAYSRTLFNTDMAKCLTVSYYALNNYSKAMFYAKKGMDLDSSNSNILYNYSALLALIEPNRYLKICYYFNKTLKKNPNDLQTVNEYALYLNKRLKFKEALSITLPYYKANRADVKLNEQITESYLGLSDYQSALNYVEYLHIANPTNYETKRRLAFTLLYLYKGDKEQLARGAGIIKDAITLNPNDAECHLIYAHYMIRLTQVSTQQNMPAQYLQCKKNAKTEYLLAKKLDKRLYDVEIENFIK